MRIVMFTNTYLPHVGGVARSVETFSRGLRRLGHEVHVVCPSFRDATESSDYVVRVPAIQNFNGSDFSLRIPFPGAISGHLYDIEPDIIHAHHPFLLGDAALRAARELAKPLVFTHHTLYERYTHYVPVNQTRLQQFVMRLSTDYANFCDHVIAPSDSIAELIRKRGVDKPITAIPTGIDLDFFASGVGSRLRQELGIPVESKVIGHLGRLAPEKNLDYLTEAVAHYLLGDPGGSSCFLVVGSGPSEARIREAFQRRGLAERLYLAGRRTEQGLADAYAAMDLFVFASQSETQGMVLAEALAAGKPVVALDATGVREVLTGSEYGRLLPADAWPETFADAIATFPLEGEAYAGHVQAARRKAREFSTEHCTDRLAAIYERLHHDSRIQAAQNGHNAWDSLLARLQVEWDLLVEKSSALMAATEISPDEVEE